MVYATAIDAYPTKSSLSSVEIFLNIVITF